MKYEITINNVKDANSNIKAFASIMIEDKINLTNIVIAQGKENDKMYVLFPNYRTNEVDKYNNPVYKEYYNPITKEFREELMRNVLAAYESEEKKYISQSDVNMTASVKVKVIAKGSQIGIASVYLNNQIAINGVRLYENQSSGNRFIGMPSQRTNKLDSNNKPEYKDICYPITKEFREELTAKVIKSYDKENFLSIENQNKYRDSFKVK